MRHRTTRLLRHALGALAALSCVAVAADGYDAATHTLSLSAVRISGTGTTYTDVVLDPGSFRVVAVGGTATGSAGARYVPAARRLALPAVTVGAASFGNVLIELGADLRIISVGGSTTQTANVPRESAASSYANKIAAAAELGPQPLPGEVLSGNAVAFADFFQDGSLGMVTHTLAYDYRDIDTATQWGQVRFYRRENGVWSDRSSLLLADSAGCLHPRKAVVADFNRDGQPDVFFACHGFDAEPFPGEQPLLLLSQPDGRYAGSKLPVTGFTHSAAAGDIDGDGFPDLLLVGNMEQSTPYFLINNRDGSFSIDLSRLPDDVKYRPIFTAELADFFGTGHYDAFLAGHESDSFNALATLYPNDGTGHFRSTVPVVMPRLAGYGFVTDVVFVGQNIYLARTMDDSAHFYDGAAIQKVSYPAMTSQSLHASTGFLPRAENWPWATSWINWIIPYQSGIVTLDSGYGISVPQ
jgi:hypothetical protein